MPEALRKDLEGAENFLIENGDTGEPEDSREKPSLHLIKSKEPEALIYDHPTREQAGSLAETLSDNTHLIPADQKTLLELRLLQDRILDNSNQARTLNFSSIRAMLDQHPEEAFLLKTYLEDAAIAFGLRLVDDKIVSESVRQARSRMETARESGGLSKAVRRLFGSSDRWSDETAIIQEMETVAAELAGQKIALAQGAAELADMGKRKEELLVSSTNEATRIIEQANRDAERIRTEAKLERAELEAQSSQLKRDNADLEGIQAQLRANPDVSAVFDQKKDQDRKKVEERLLVELNVLAELWSNSYTEEDESPRRASAEPRERVNEVLKNIYKLLGAFKQKLLLPLAKFETQFNSEERVALANKLVLEAKKALGDRELNLRDMKNHSRKKQVLKSEFFSKILFALVDERVSMDQALAVYDQLIEGIREQQTQLEALNTQIKPVPEKLSYEQENQLEEANTTVLEAMDQAVEEIGSLYSQAISELTNKKES